MIFSPLSLFQGFNGLCAIQERDRNDFPICRHFGVSALAWMILKTKALNTTAHLVAEFARIQIEVPSEFWRIQLRMDRRCAVV